MIANMNNIGTMSGYLYRHTEQERFKINTYGFRYWNDKCFSIDMSKDHDYPIIFLKRTCLLKRSKRVLEYKYEHYRNSVCLSERERFKINTFGFQYGNVQCF